MPLSGNDALVAAPPVRMDGKRNGLLSVSSHRPRHNHKKALSFSFSPIYSDDTVLGLLIVLVCVLRDKLMMESS